MRHTDSPCAVPARTRLVRSLARLGLLAVAVMGLTPAAAPAAVGPREYIVGDGAEFSDPDFVPWDSLHPGDVVTIRWRAQPYRAKWVLACRGTEEAPITIRGQLGPQGELPVLEADGAATPPRLDYWSQQRGVIKIGGSSYPPDIMPGWIVIAGLDIRGARPGRTFVGRKGVEEYSESASAIFIEKGDHITIRSCKLHDCANGLFSASESKELLVEGCYIYDNGIPGSTQQHNNYTESSGITFQYNRFGPLIRDALGSNLKDRSSRLVVRYNIIEGGNRQLDLVESQEGREIVEHPDYHAAHVYGNLLIERDGDGNPQIVHFGGDSGPEDDFRTGPLYFYHNTIVSSRRAGTTLLRLSTARQSADVFNNLIVLTQEGGRLGLLDEQGTLRFHHNALQPGWRKSNGQLLGDITSVENIESDDLRFHDLAQGDYRPLAGSPAVNSAAPLPAAVSESHPLIWEIVPPHSFRKRTAPGGFDIGAMESE